MRVRDTLTGFVLGVTLASGAWLFYVPKVNAKIAALNAKADYLAAQQALDSARVDSSMVAQAQHDSTAEKASRRAERIRLGAVAQRIPAPCLTPGAPTGDDVIMVPLDTALAWKYAWEAERTARLHAVRVLIPDLQASLATANARIGVLEQGNALRDKQITGLQWRNKLTAPIGMGVGALVVLAVLRVR